MQITHQEECLVVFTQDLGIWGSHQTLWSLPLSNVTWHSGTWPYTMTPSIDQALHQFANLLPNWINHTSWVAIVTPTDRPKLVRNCCLIELFCGVVCVVTLHFWHFCWCRGFVIGLRQISSFFFLPILTLLPYCGGFHGTLQRVWLANRECLFLRTPDPVPFWACICSNIETILSWTCHVYGPFEFRTSLCTSILLVMQNILRYHLWGKRIKMHLSIPWVLDKSFPKR